MPMHDWTAVNAGTYHALHSAWITHLQEALNGGVLPNGYYALGEQRAGDVGPDLLALHDAPGKPDVTPAPAEDGMIAVAEAPPKVQAAVEAHFDAAFYMEKRRSLVIRHVSGDRIVALMEIVSPGNKHSHSAIDDFVDKALAALKAGIHIMVIDPFPCGRHDPQGIHGAIWESLGEPVVEPPADRPLMLVSYCAKSPVTAYVEPTGIGLPLTEMPLFLTKTHYVRTPLEETYMQAWAGLPERWRRVVEFKEARLN